MQPAVGTIVQPRYVPNHAHYPTVHSNHMSSSIKSIDGTVYGPSVPPIKNSKNSSTVSHQNDIDFRRLILFNLPHDLVQEYLELYLEYLSGESEIERIDYSNLEDTTVMVTFKNELGKLTVVSVCCSFNVVFLLNEYSCKI